MVTILKILLIQQDEVWEKNKALKPGVQELWVQSLVGKELGQNWWHQAYSKWVWSSYIMACGFRIAHSAVQRNPSTWNLERSFGTTVSI